MRVQSIILLSAGALLLSATAFPVQQDTLRVEVQLVNVVATVTDRDGNYVPDLGPDNFIIEDEGIVQEVAHFANDSETPVSLGVLIDTSGSMARRMRTALTAVERFAGTLLDADEVFVATFSDRVSLVEDLTNDRQQLSRALGRLRVSGGTALYDALSAGIGEVRSGRHDKRAILVLTDGSDTASDLDLEDALDAIRGAEVLVYALGIDPIQFADPTDHVPFEWPVPPIPGVPALPSLAPQTDPVEMEVLESFALASGGKSFLVRSTWTDGTASEIDRVLDEVSAELRNQYTIGYYPSTVADGRFHEIRLRVREEDYTVRARSGYRSQKR